MIQRSPSGRVTLASGHAYDEVLYAPRHVDPAELLAIVNLGGPLTDASSVIDAASRNVTAGTSRIDGTGLAVRDEGDALKVVAGDIRGLPNVPGGKTHGVWAGSTVMDDEGLSVYDEAGERQVRLGRIAGLPGV